MEPGIREFFKRLSATIGLFVIWMSINMVVGIKYQFAFINDGLRWFNIVFYVWVFVSFIVLILLYIKMWSKPIENLTD